MAIFNKSLKQYFELKNIAAYVTLLVALLISAALLVNIHNKTNFSTDALKHFPNSFMTDVKATKMNEQGYIANQMHAKKLVHYPHDNSTTMVAPYFIIHNNDEPAWRIWANSGKALQGTDIVDLWDNVKIHQARGSHNYDTTLLTQALRIFTVKKVAETHKPVTMFQPGSTIDAVGMRVDMKGGWVKFLKDARGLYDPKQYQNQ